MSGVSSLVAWASTLARSLTPSGPRNPGAPSLAPPSGGLDARRALQDAPGRPRRSNLVPAARMRHAQSLTPWHGSPAPNPPGVRVRVPSPRSRGPRTPVPARRRFGIGTLPTRLRRIAWLARLATWHWHGKTIAETAPLAPTLARAPPDMDYQPIRDRNGFPSQTRAPYFH
jgi:hypothetical protein